LNYLIVRYDEEEEVEAPKKKKVEIVKPKMRSMLLSKLPKAKTDLNSMNSKVSISSPATDDVSSSQEVPIQPKPGVKAKATMFMPNSTKLKQQKKIDSIISAKADIQSKKKKKAEEEDSDDDAPFFSFTSKEEETAELKNHRMEAGPSRPTKDMIRESRKVYSTPSTEDETIYSQTRQPDEDSAIAPYGSDISVYNQIAGPSHKIDERRISNADLDVDAMAIQALQGKKGKRENVNFMDASVDTSLGNIRENIRKGANQKHISTSMVDPLKQMKKSDPNAHVSKRTHQLKYLVELAKANETRLDQLWSNAKSSSRSTAMKYGW